MTNNEAARVLAMTQGTYFAATGIWPRLDMRSFEKVTGPKVDCRLDCSAGLPVTWIV